jgi:hypothetical protein
MHRTLHALGEIAQTFGTTSQTQQFYAFFFAVAKIMLDALSQRLLLLGGA